MAAYNLHNSIKNPPYNSIPHGFFPGYRIPYHTQTNIVSNSRWNPLINRHPISNSYNIPAPILLSTRDRIQTSINESKNKAIKLIRLNITYKSPGPVEPNISIEVPTNFSLYQIHNIIQSLFLFNDSHLHQFKLTINSETLTFSLPDPDSDEWQTYCNSDGYHWISHYHPHDLAEYMFTGRTNIECKWICDERVISIYDTLCLNDEQKECKVLEYEYDFGACHEIYITAEEVRTIINPKDLKYPKIITANQGTYYGEDRNLICRFDISLAQQQIDLIFDRQWPLELKQNEKVVKHCYVCKNSNKCGNRTQCSGAGCCMECIKIDIMRNDIDFDEMYLEYKKVKRELQMEHLRKVNGENCNYIEADGIQCTICFQ